jgi:predicted DCC family thiol-disulfide oxidoreductase YuxK
MLRIDFQKKFRFAPLQSRVGKDLLVSIGKEADDISSVVLVKRSTGESFDKSRCVLKVVEELGPLAKIVSSTALNVVPEELRDAVYDTVAENRYNLMGKRDECRCSDPEFSDRFLLD